MRSSSRQSITGETRIWLKLSPTGRIDSEDGQGEGETEQIEATSGRIHPQEGGEREAELYFIETHLTAVADDDEDGNNGEDAPIRANKESLNLLYRRRRKQGAGPPLRHRRRGRRSGGRRGRRREIR
uniref:Uncharacterized protein n=1 Tax=Setaria italica TaxID=4555 RepID=K3XSH3_SETIT